MQVIQHLEGILSHILIWLTICASVSKLVMLVNLKKKIEKYSAAEREFMIGSSKFFALTSIPIISFCEYVIFEEVFIIKGFNFWTFLLSSAVFFISVGNFIIVNNYETKMLKECNSRQSMELKTHATKDVAGADVIIKNEKSTSINDDV